MKQWAALWTAVAEAAEADELRAVAEALWAVAEAAQAQAEAEAAERNTLNETEERKLIEVCIANVDYVLKEVENEYQIAFSWRILESFTRRHLKK